MSKRRLYILESYVNSVYRHAEDIMQIRHTLLGIENPDSCLFHMLDTFYKEFAPHDLTSKPE